MRKTLLFFSICLQASLPLIAQVHEQSDSYVWPEEPGVLSKLTEWQDLKFGMIIHWGLYAELGIVESWSICSEQEDWISRDSTIRYDDYKRRYWSTIDTFNPVKFDPASWAKAGKNAGMNYLVFTTKHHDGFCLYDTKYTDFSIMNGAFKGDPRSNVTKEVFDAFRKENYMIGAYFSKPDWHSQYYWWDRYATPNRHQNYKIENFPWRWNVFKNFVYNQIEELVNGDYGTLDILWLDGGWVRNNIDMPEIARMARSYQKDLLIVDRTVPGKYENYQTPERGIPQKQEDNPWESCIPLGDDWGFTPGDDYKSPTKVIHSLVEIVAKGGNLLLGIGPKADGTLPEEVILRLHEIGQWLDKNGEAIYNTRNAAVYNDGNTWFTKSKDGKTIYAIVCLEEGKPLPTSVSWKGNEPVKSSEMRLLQTQKTVKWRKSGGAVEVMLPKNLPAGTSALAFSFQI
ncbi:MAG: alpha-L-fucosidase [Candidatus Symbiothrix sp.]|jgi:alpha-L-fucosidase|nr:alpha-L-fucosidase [Candidatus Symbiothrix sp.]